MIRKSRRKSTRHIAPLWPKGLEVAVWLREQPFERKSNERSRPLVGRIRCDTGGTSMPHNLHVKSAE